MSAPETIAVAIDFSGPSRDALRQAVRIAGWSDASVRAVHVVPIPLVDPMLPPLVPMNLPSVEFLIDDARKRWAEFAGGEASGGNISLEIRVGNARAEILDAAAASRAGLLVMGVSGAAGAGAALGSTASACVRKAPCDVLLVRRSSVAPFKSVAACIDLSPVSSAVLERAIRFAAQEGAALTILHVYDDPWHGLSAPDVIQKNMPEFRATLNQAVETRLREFCEPFAHELGGLKARFEAVQSDPKWGSYGRGIARFLADHSIDLGVLATHSRQSLREFLLGSTAERVLHDAPRNLLAVRPA